MKIRQKRYPEMVIDSPDLFRVDVKTKYGNKAGWMKGSGPSMLAYDFYCDAIWEEVSEETWEDVTVTGDMIKHGSLYGEAHGISGCIASTPPNWRFRRDEGWVKVSELVEYLHVRGWLSVAQTQALKQGCHCIQRPVLLVERRKE